MKRQWYVTKTLSKTYDIPTNKKEINKLKDIYIKSEDIVLSFGVANFWTQMQINLII